jgi:hypothetical protein
MFCSYFSPVLLLFIQSLVFFPKHFSARYNIYSFLLISSTLFYSPYDQHLILQHFTNAKNPLSRPPESANTSESRKGSGSGGSGYVSDRNNSLHPGCPPTVKRICCPTCGARAEVPHGGVSLFPPNYLLQHRMVLATLNAHNTHLLCDVCTSDVSVCFLTDTSAHQSTLFSLQATARCMDCAISFCDRCEELHLRQKSAAGHEVLSLEEARRKGITKVRRQIMCVQHPELELCLFCSSCCQVG